MSRGISALQGEAEQVVKFAFVRFSSPEPLCLWGLLQPELCSALSRVSCALPSCAFTDTVSLLMRAVGGGASHV